MNAPDDAAPASPSLMRRRGPFLAPLWLLGLGGVVMMIGAILYWNSATTTTIVVIRHAEKQLNTISDAPLSPPGETRASRLAQMFGDAEAFGRVGRIYVTDTRRSQQTAAALAQRLGVTPVIIEGKPEPSAIAKRVLGENRGGVALVVGHSNTVPEIVKSLVKADAVPAMGDEEFDTLYVVSVPTIGKASVVRLKY